MTERKGILPNQPLFYVLASMRFQPWMLLPAKIAEMQDSLRERFPLVNQLVFDQYTQQPQSFAPDSPQQETPLRRQLAWSFMKADRTLGCQISMDQIVVHALEYTEFSLFAEAMKFVVDIVQKHARHFDVNAIGIRYLDQIAPIDNERLEDYLVPGFLPQPLDSADFKTIGGMSQTVYSTNTGVLQARFWTGNGFGYIPDDLVPLYVLTQDLASGDSPLKPLPAGHGTLDSDSIWTAPQPVSMNSDEIIAKLHDLHVHANAFFRSACSEHAFNVWRRKD